MERCAERFVQHMKIFESAILRDIGRMLKLQGSRNALNSIRHLPLLCHRAEIPPLIKASELLSVVTSSATTAPYPESLQTRRANAAPNDS